MGTTRGGFPLPCEILGSFLPLEFYLCLLYIELAPLNLTGSAFSLKFINFLTSLGMSLYMLGF